MLPGLHVAVFLFSALLKVGSGDDVSADLCELPNGVFSDPDNCAQFIRCRSGVPDVEFCPDKLLYNPLILTCDFSKTEKCSEPGDFEITTPLETNDVACSEDGPNIYIIQSSCTEYYICKNDTAFKVECPGGLQMNADKMTCDYPENVDCDAISSPEESAVGMKAIYGDDKGDLEPETSVAFSSTDSNVAPAKTDTSSSRNPENTTFLPNENITNENPILKETDQQKANETLDKVVSTQTMFNQNTTTTTFALVSTSTNTRDVNDELMASTSVSPRERSNVEDSREVRSKLDFETTSVTDETNISADDFYDYASGESSEPDLYEDGESVTALKFRDEDTNGSGSDADVIDIFTPESNDEFQKSTLINISKDTFTEDLSVSNTSLMPTNYTLSPNKLAEDELMTPSISTITIENESTLNSEEKTGMTKVTDNLSGKGSIGSETTESEAFVSSQKETTNNKASVDDATSAIKIAETVTTDSNLNGSTTPFTILSSLGSTADLKIENYSKETTKVQTTVIETDSNIAPGTTLTTTQALMSSDPLTDNETTKTTTLTYSETAKVTPKYVIDINNETEEYQSIDAEIDKNKSPSVDQNAGISTESIGGSHLTLNPSSIFFTEEPITGLEDFASSKNNENSILLENYTDVPEMDITSEDIILNKLSSLPNEVSTQSVLQLQVNSTSSSSFTNEEINMETETSPKIDLSGHITENDISEAYNFSSPDFTSHTLTETDTNETSSGISHSTYLDKSSDSHLINTTATSENMIETSQNNYSIISTLTNAYPTKESSIILDTLLDNDLSSDSNNSLTSTRLTTADFKLVTHIPREKSTKMSQTTSEEEITELRESTNSSTLEYVTNTDAIPVFTEHKNTDLSSAASISETKSQDNTTEEIDLSSESDVSKVDPTYIDMYTNNSISSLTNSDIFVTAKTDDQEILTNHSYETSMKENPKSTLSELQTSSTSEKYRSTPTESSNDSNTLLYNVTEVTDINVTNEEHPTSEDISKDTRANSKETGFPYEILSSTLTEESTNYPDLEFISKTSKESSTDSNTMSSVRHQTNATPGISKNSVELDDVTISTSGGSMAEYITPTENASTSTNDSIRNLNGTTVNSFIHTSSNEVTQTVLETKFFTDQTDTSSTTLSTNNDLYEITSNSINPRNSTVTNANSKSSEYTENFEHDSSDTLQANATESTTEIDKRSQLSASTSEDFGIDKIKTAYVLDTSVTGKTNTNMYDELSTFKTTNFFENTSVVTASAVMESTNETSESFWPETKEISTKNNTRSMIVSSTTNFELISVSDVSNEISNVASTISVTDFYNETSSDIIQTTELPSNDSSAGISDTLISDHSTGVKTEESQSPEYDLRDFNGTSKFVITSTTDFSTSSETENSKSPETPVDNATEMTSTKLNSPGISETTEFTGRKFEGSSPDVQTNLDISLRTTLNTDRPTKSDTDFQTISSVSINETSDITSSDLINLNTFNASDIETSTKITAYNETSEIETLSENSTSQSHENSLSSNDILEERTSSVQRLITTSETTSNTIIETSDDTTNNVLPASTKVSINSSDIDSNAVNTSELFSTSVPESIVSITGFEHENLSSTETGVNLSTYVSTDSTSKIVSSTTLINFPTESPVEIPTNATDITTTGTSSQLTDVTRDNFINNRTETTLETSNADSISTAIATHPEDSRETHFTLSTYVSSEFETTVMQTRSSNSISESDLLTVPTIEVTVNETTVKLYTDTTNTSTASRNLEKETYSTELSSIAYLSTALRTETSYPSSNIATESEFRDISSTDTSISPTTVTKDHSTDISKSDLPVNFTTEIKDFDDTNETTTESNMDISSISVASRNVNEETESSEYESTTHFPAAFRTETSHSSFNTETDSELQRISSSDTPPESSSTVNPICVTLDGNFPYPDDCNKFYYCAKGVPLLSSCVGNEHFDPVKRICTDPCLAKCDPNADCSTTESKTNTEESSSQTTLKDNSTSESYNTGTEEIFQTITTDYFIEDTTPTLISRSTSNEISTENSPFQTSTLESTTGKYGTYSLTPSNIVDANVTKDVNETSSDDYIGSTFTDIPISESNWTDSDVPVTTTTATYEITSETQTEIIENETSTVKSTETTYETSFKTSESTMHTDISSDSSGDGEDASSASPSLVISTECENEDCFSSKVPTSATLVPFTLCPRTDFLPQPNCNEYLDCTSQVPNKMQCQMGLHFNPSTRVCDWPHKANCGKLPEPLYEPADFKCPCQSCLVPSAINCSHYYLCLGSTAYEMKCSNSLLFDRSRNTCNFAPLVDCADLPPSTEIEPMESSTKLSTYFSSSTTVSSTVAPFICPSREGLFRYPDNCGMFYQCSNWIPNAMRCAATTHFSEITKRCEYPCDAKCDLTLNCGRPSTAAPNDPRCSCMNCRLPSPESCTKYIVCVNGRARIEYCPWGKTFDARRSTCDWAHKVSCQHSSMCPERNGLFSHKDDCHKFVHCSNGIPYVKNCPSILEFDPIKQRCEWPTGRCNNLPIIVRDVDYKNEQLKRKGWKCPKTFGYFSNDKHCNKFYHCSFGTPTLKECPPGLLYNSRYQTCDWEKQVRCHSNRHQKPRRCRIYDHHVICSEDRKPKPHVLCNMYYDCTAGRACAKQCPVGLYFNNMTGVCDLPKNVKCLNPGKENYSLKDLSLKCASGDYARQVNPTNDSCFYHCRQGKVVSGCCSKGHVYNLHKDKCERRTKSLRI